MLTPGILEFRVTHNFGDIAGDNGGVKNFFGLDNAADVRIGFQYGVSKRLNLIAARIKGAGSVRQMMRPESNTGYCNRRTTRSIQYQ